LSKTFSGLGLLSGSPLERAGRLLSFAGKK